MNDLHVSYYGRSEEKYRWSNALGHEIQRLDVSPLQAKLSKVPRCAVLYSSVCDVREYGTDDCEIVATMQPQTYQRGTAAPPISPVAAGLCLGKAISKENISSLLAPCFDQIVFPR